MGANKMHVEVTTATGLSVLIDFEWPKERKHRKAWTPADISEKGKTLLKLRNQLLEPIEEEWSGAI